MNIVFEVNSQRVSVSCHRIVAESVGYVTFRCQFDEEWDSYVKAAIFTNGDVSKAVLLTGSEPVNIPFEVLKAGKLYFSAVGVKDGGRHRITTRKMDLPITVYEAGRQGADAVVDYTPELWEQTVAAVEAFVGAAPNLTVGTVETLSANSDVYVTVSGTAGSPVLNFGIPQGARGAKGDQGNKGEKGDKGDRGEKGEKGDSPAQSELISLVNEAVSNLFDRLEGEVSGNPAYFDNGADAPIKSLSLSWEPKQSGSGTPSAENIRPVSGRTSASVMINGSSNMLGGERLRDAILNAIPGAVNVAESRYVRFSSTAAVESSIVSGLFKENTRYTFILTLYKTSGTGANLRIYYTDGTYDSISVSAAGEVVTVVIRTKANKTVSFLGKYNSGGTTWVYYDRSGIFEGLNSAEDFEEYRGSITEVSWENEAGTVYGGSAEYDGFGTWTLTKAYDFIPSYNGESLPGSWVSSMDVYSVGAVPTAGAQVAYELETPVTYTVTSQRLYTLPGVNNIFSDTGTVSVTYKIDPITALKRLIEVYLSE